MRIWMMLHFLETRETWRELWVIVINKSSGSSGAEKVKSYLSFMDFSSWLPGSLASNVGMEYGNLLDNVLGSSSGSFPLLNITLAVTLLPHISQTWLLLSQLSC